jgi:hypothetical protein
MSALAVLAKNANNTASTPARSMILFLFFDIIPLIGTPPNIGLHLLSFVKAYVADVKAINAGRHRTC